MELRSLLLCRRMYKYGDGESKRSLRKAWQNADLRQRIVTILHTG